MVTFLEFFFIVADNVSLLLYRSDRNVVHEAGPFNGLNNHSST